MRCQIWSSFWLPLVSAACRLQESDSSSFCIGAPMQVRSDSCCSRRFAIAMGAGSPCAELWS
jgi:hypothetical protein